MGRQKQQRRNAGKIRGPTDKNNDEARSNTAPDDNVLRRQAGGAKKL